MTSAIILLGLPGSGKGTQAKLLAERLGYLHADMGAILRAEAETGGFIAEHIREVMSHGDLLEDGTILMIFRSWLEENLDNSSGVVLDGIPRRPFQAENILEYFRAKGVKDFKTVLLALTPEESEKRLLLRAETEHRGDDVKEVIHERIKAQTKELQSIVDILKEQTEYHEVDGMPSIEEVRASVWIVFNL